jgi:hypothetical protein
MDQRVETWFIYSRITEQATYSYLYISEALRYEKEVIKVGCVLEVFEVVLEDGPVSGDVVVGSVTGLLDLLGHGRRSAAEDTKLPHLSRNSE